MKCGFLPGCSAHLDVECGLNTAKLPWHMRGAISFVGVNVFVGIGIFGSQDFSFKCQTSSENIPFLISSTVDGKNPAPVEINGTS